MFLGMDMPSEIEKLFERFATELTGMQPERCNTVLCPLCTCSFSRSDLTQRDENHLTLEHILPGAIGGQWKTLTCKRCNNTHGSALDGHLVRMIDAHNWADGDGSTLKGRFGIDGIEVPMKLTWGAGDSPNTIAIPGASGTTLADLKARMSTLGDGDQLKIHLNFDYIPSRAQRALVRIAYLTLFQTCGYQYVLSEAGKRIRSLIDGHDDAQLRQFTPELRDIEETSITNPVIITPIGTIAHLIIVRIAAAKRTCHYGVLLPSSSVPAERIASVLSEVMTGLHGNEVAIKVSV